MKTTAVAWSLDAWVPATASLGPQGKCNEVLGWINSARGRAEHDSDEIHKTAQAVLFSVFNSTQTYVETAQLAAMPLAGRGAKT